MGILHPLISHGFLGDHGVYLTPAQFIMHTIALLLFALLLTAAQNRSLHAAGIFSGTLEGVLPMALFMPVVVYTAVVGVYAWKVAPRS